MSRSRGAALFLAVLAAGSCGGEPPPAPGDPACAEVALVRTPEAASVVLVVNDTMRRDRVGAYGGPARTPVFDRFAREHLLFERAAAAAPWTKPSVASLFTSRHPSQHGVASDPHLRARGAAGTTVSTDVLAPELTTLAEHLRAAGLRTAAFVANPWLTEAHGFAQGFETWDDSFADWDLSGDAVSAAALAWLAGLAPGERFFLYVHYIDSHRPYGPVEPEALAALPPPAPGETPLLEREARELARTTLVRTDGSPLVPPGEPVYRAAIELAYDRGLERFDRALGALLDGLRASEAWERTAVLVTSDHGEALFERGYGNHGTGLFDDEAAVPLAARLPGTTPASGTVGCPVGLVDVAPSLCAWLGLPPPPDAAGWSFVASPALAPPAGRRFVVTEGTMVDPRQRSIRDRRHKLLYEPAGRRGGGEGSSPWSLYDLVADPGERVDLLALPDPPDGVQELARTLERELARAVPAGAAPARTFAPVDAGQAERLRDLGYAGAERPGG